MERRRERVWQRGRHILWKRIFDRLFLPLKMEVGEKQININNFASGEIYTLLFLE